MVTVASVPWPVLGAAVSAVGTLALVGYTYRHRGKPGANWFMLALSCQAAWAVVAAVAWLVFDPGLRLVLEQLVWVPVSWMGFLFLGFALDYTGRGQALRSWWFRSLAAVPAVGTALALTNGRDGFVWTAFRVDPVFGVAAVDYAFEPLGYLVIGAGLSFAGVAALLLVDTILSYGPLYRREAVAVALSAVPGGVAVVAWAFEVGPLHPLNPVPLSFLPHILLDAYAFVGTDIFESNPTTRRAAERSAIADLESPVVVLDPQDRVVESNAAARATFDPLADPAADQAVTDVVGEAFDPGTTERVSVRDGGRRREFAVSRSELTDPTGTDVGRLLVFQDITDERRREQQLAVLNRVLRHNLRNGMSAILGHASLIRDEAEDDRFRRGASVIERRGRRLVTMGDKARTFERVIEREPVAEVVDVGALLEEVATDVEAAFEGRVTVEVPSGTTLRADRELLRLACENLVENGLAHNDAADPEVSVRASVSDRNPAVLALTVSDNGPGIPDDELAVLRAGGEDPLQHSQGVGLWLVEWSVDALGGTTSYEVDPEGSTVTVEVPAGTEAGGDADEPAAAAGTDD